MLQARPTAPIEDEFSSWIRESVDRDDDEEALEIAMGNKPLRNSESVDEKTDEKSESRLKRSISNGSRGKQVGLEEIHIAFANIPLAATKRANN